MSQPGPSGPHTSPVLPSAASTPTTPSGPSVARGLASPFRGAEVYRMRTPGSWFPGSLFPPTYPPNLPKLSQDIISCQAEAKAAWLKQKKAKKAAAQTAAAPVPNLTPPPPPPIFQGSFTTKAPASTTTASKKKKTRRRGLNVKLAQPGDILELVTIAHCCECDMR